MHGGFGLWADALNAFFWPVLLIAGAMAVAWSRRKARLNALPVPDGPPDEAYKVYTTKYDLELISTDIPEKLRLHSLDHSRGWTNRTDDAWQRSIALAEEEATNQAHATLQLAAHDPEGIAVSLLVDHSGSMRGRPIAATVAGLDMVADMLSSVGITYEILGFSTVGWQGGAAYDRWKWNGQPRRPGRLCALLHVVYKSCEESAWTAASRSALLHPDILRENVDGEAIEWAARRLDAISARQKILIVVSDGAPVDDATFLHNGEGYLHRHLHAVISRMEGADSGVSFGAVGIGYDVAPYYRRCRVAELDTVAENVTALIAEMLEEAPFLQR